MFRKSNNKGITLVELVVVVLIIGILASSLAPQVVKFVGMARKVEIETEASEFMKCAQIAYITVSAQGKAPGSDCVKNKTKTNSPYYKNGTLYGNLTNWTVHNGVVAGASNGPFADEFFSLLAVTYGTGWRTGNSSVPISEKQPKINPAGSMTKECIFQVFYDKTGKMIVEYSRDGYFVRMEGSHLVESVKIKNANEKHFTSWQ